MAAMAACGLGATAAELLDASARASASGVPAAPAHHHDAHRDSKRPIFHPLVSPLLPAQPALAMRMDGADTPWAARATRRHPCPARCAQAQRGWSSDPCGPVLYKGRYHL
jgi:hypothetical protein